MMITCYIYRWENGLSAYLVLVGELIEKVLGFLFHGGTQPKQLNTSIC